MKQFTFLVGLVVVVAMAIGCGGGSPAPQAPAVAAVPEIESMVLAKAFETDEKKAMAEYNGKTFVVKNLLVYSTDNEKNQISGTAYDPTAKTASVANIKPKFKEQLLATGSEFGFEVFPAEPKTSDKYQGSNNVGQGEERFTLYTELVNVEGTLEYTEGNNSLNVNKAKLK